MQLSICIPTYNRAAYLAECLESIVQQCSDSYVKDRVEIVISDNGSTDNTREIVASYTAVFPHITYTRNGENLGFDRNVLNVVAHAQGEYCWLMGDDDALFPSALAHLLRVLDEHKAAYYLVNCWGYDQQLHVQAVSHPNMDLVADQSYAKLRNFVQTIVKLQDVVGYFGGMSCQVFQKSMWDNFAKKESRIGTQTIHLFVIVEACKSLPAYVVAEPLVKTRANNMRWDSFPGLESIRKRNSFTKQTLLWVLTECNVPYSRLKIELFYYKSLAYGVLLGLAKKTVLKSNLIKKVIKQLAGV